MYVVTTQMVAIKPCLRNRWRYQIPRVDGKGFPTPWVSTGPVEVGAALGELDVTRVTASLVPLCYLERGRGTISGPRPSPRTHRDVAGRGAHLPLLTSLAVQMTAFVR